MSYLLVNIEMYLPIQHLISCLRKPDLQIIWIAFQDLRVPPQKKIFNSISKLNKLESTNLFQTLILRPRICRNFEDLLMDIHEANFLHLRLPAQRCPSSSAQTFADVKIYLHELRIRRAFWKRPIVAAHYGQGTSELCIAARFKMIEYLS